MLENDNLLKSIIDNLDSALAIFDKSGDLIITNKAANELWRLNSYPVPKTSSIVDFFQILRETKLYPEKDDFNNFTQNLQKLIDQQKAITIKENLILPNGTHIEEQIIKTPSNYIVVFWKDTSELWNITYNLNSHRNIYQRLIDRNPSSLVVVRSDGLVDQYNTKFLELFNFSIQYINSQPHITSVLTAILEQISPVEAVDHTIIVKLILNNKSFDYEIELNDDKLLQIFGIALPNSKIFVIFNQISTILSSNYQSEAASLKDSLNKLHEEFVVDIGTVATQPLSVIMGFSNILKNEYVGTLNLRQKDYIEKILTYAKGVQKEVDYKIQLGTLDAQEYIEFHKVDIHILTARLLEQIQPRVSSKNIKLSLNIANNHQEIITNENLLLKAITLLLFYLIEQNTPNSQMEILIKQKTQESHFCIKDISQAPLLSSNDRKRYDVHLALTILKKLQIKLDHAYKKQAKRTLTLIIPLIISS